MNTSDSIFRSSLRALFVAFFAILGICLAILAFVALIDSISTTEETKLNTVYTQDILPNADGVRKSLSKEAPVILQVNVEGVIGADPLTTQSFRQLLIESREGDLKNNRVKAILLRIDSPGGTVVDSDGIYRLLKEYKAKYKVPVYAFVDGLCASGGMNIACAADKIYASNVSLVGSVGVLAPSFFNFTQVMEKIGVQSVTLTAGKNKDMMNPFRPWKADESQPLQSILNYYYDRFVDVVTENRPTLDRKKLVEVYGANIFPAEIAKEHGYIDESGMSLSDALRKVLKDLGIDGDFYQVVQLQKGNWFTSLFSAESPVFTGQIKHQLVLTPELDPALMNKYLYLYTPQ